MAASEYEVIVPKRYGTRMLQAGDRIELTNPRGRIYSALGFVKPFSGAAPKAPEPSPEPAPAPAPAVVEPAAPPKAAAPKPAPKAPAKKAPAKRKAKAKK